MLLTHQPGASAALTPAFSFELQFAVPAEELACGASSRDLRRVQFRVETVLSLATRVCLLLEPLGWRLLTVRFDDEVCVTLAKIGNADCIIRDLAALPESVLTEIGESVRLCATLGDHVFELQLQGGRLKPLNPADSTVLQRLID